MLAGRPPAIAGPPSPKHTVTYTAVRCHGARHLIITSLGGNTVRRRAAGSGRWRRRRRKPLRRRTAHCGAAAAVANPSAGRTGRTTGRTIVVYVVITAATPADRRRLITALSLALNAFRRPIPLPAPAPAPGSARRAPFFVVGGGSVRIST